MAVFQKNRMALKKICPGLIRRLDRCSKNTSDIEVFPSSSGAMTCRALTSDGRRMTLHSTVDPENESNLLLKRLGGETEGVLVLLGVGLGYPVSGLMNLKDLEARTIVVVEKDLSLFKWAMELFDWTPLLNKADVHLLVGEESDQILKSITRIRMNKGFQNLTIIPHGPSTRRDPDFYRPLIDQLRQMETSPFRVGWGSRSFAKDHLTILLLDSNYFLVRECVKALKRLGHRVIRLSISEGHLVERILSRVAQNRPDFLLSVNHLGFDEEGKLTELLGNLNLPFAVWYVDSPTFVILNFRKNVSPDCVLFVWDRTYLDPMKACGFQKVHFLPLATDPSIFKPVRRSTVPPHFQGPVSFVGNSMVEAVDDWFARFPRSETTESITRLAIPLQIKNHQQSMEQVLKQIAREHGRQPRFGDPVHHLYLQAALVWKATLQYRRDLLERLQPFDIRVFGDQGWHQILNGGVKILPPVNYHRELPLVFNGTDVNVNATSFQMVSAVNQRVFDTAACGAFLVTDHQPDMDELFDRTRETVCYDDPAEAKEQVAYYLKHPRVRCEIAQRARDRVLGEHTYVHRLTKMIAVMKHEFGSF
jgi:spore maturation protein CgeB